MINRFSSAYQSLKSRHIVECTAVGAGAPDFAESHWKTATTTATNRLCEILRLISGFTMNLPFA